MSLGDAVLNCPSFLEALFWGWRNCCYIAIQVSDLTKLTIN